MSEKIEFEVTEEAVERIGNAHGVRSYTCDASGRNVQHTAWRFTRDELKAALTAALAHPSFQSQLRAYVAGEMRGLVAEEDVWNGDADTFGEAEIWNACRAETLANIAAYEQEQEDGK